VGMLTGILMALYMMYFIIPLLSTEHTNFNMVVNATDPTIVTSYNLGQGFYTIIPLIPIFVGVFVLINYSLKRSVDD
jgi:hypothetical protein